jgi:hypothetical protein
MVSSINRFIFISATEGTGCCLSPMFILQPLIYKEAEDLEERTRGLTLSVKGSKIPRYAE